MGGCVGAGTSACVCLYLCLFACACVGEKEEREVVWEKGSERQMRVLAGPKQVTERDTHTDRQTHTHTHTPHTHLNGGDAIGSGEAKNRCTAAMNEARDGEGRVGTHMELRARNTHACTETQANRQKHGQTDRDTGGQKDEQTEQHLGSNLGGSSTVRAA